MGENSRKSRIVYAESRKRRKTQFESIYFLNGNFQQFQIHTYTHKYTHNHTKMGTYRETVRFLSETPFMETFVRFLIPNVGIRPNVCGVYESFVIVHLLALGRIWIVNPMPHKQGTQKWRKKTHQQQKRSRLIEKKCSDIKIHPKNGILNKRAPVQVEMKLNGICLSRRSMVLELIAK